MMQAFIAIAALALIALEGVSAFIPQHKTVTPTFGIVARLAPLRAVAEEWDNNAKEAATEAGPSERRADQAGTVVEGKPVVGKALKLIIAGAPASGKGTQCAMIKDKYGVVHLSTGDMLRAAVAAGTEIGMKAKDFMDNGKLVPDEVMIGIVKDRLNEKDCQTSGWLLDGFPRTQAQAQALADAGVVADCFLSLNVPDDMLIERVVGRRTDPVTGAIYHMTFSPPPADIVDRLEQRSDDTEEKCRVRLEQFHANVEAVKGSYVDISVEIDGTQKPEKVQEAIAAFIGTRVAA